MQPVPILSRPLARLIGAVLILAVALVGCDRSTPQERAAREWREQNVKIVADIRNLVAAGQTDEAVARIKSYRSAGIKDPRLDELSRSAEASRLRSLAVSATTGPGRMAALERLVTLGLATDAERDQLALLQRQQAQEAKQRAQEAATKKAHDTQLQVAILAARVLKSAMKDPEAFQLKSLLVMRDGTGCYEYRAKNTFGAMFPGSAVLTSKGKMLLQERDGNAFVGAWNKSCTDSGGTELVPLIEQRRLLD